MGDRYLFTYDLLSFNSNAKYDDEGRGDKTKGVSLVQNNEHRYFA